MPGVNAIRNVIMEKFSNIILDNEIDNNNNNDNNNYNDDDGNANNSTNNNRTADNESNQNDDVQAKESDPNSFEKSLQATSNDLDNNSNAEIVMTSMSNINNIATSITATSSNESSNSKAVNDTMRIVITEDQPLNETQLAIYDAYDHHHEYNEYQTHYNADEYDTINDDNKIHNIIKAGDMAQLAEIVLNGNGNLLMNMKASQPDVQAFLNNVPNYMTKIRHVHEAARNGSLLSLQQALDRRKFAIARNYDTPNGATPLHVAVLFGNSDILRYLASRFPETTSTIDYDGRTPLHYAAVLNDNGYFYNLLVQLGANPHISDRLGYTPEQYLKNDHLKKDILNYRKLLQDFRDEKLQERLKQDQGQIESQSFQDNPIFKTEQGKYLADNLASPLIKGLTHIANERPKDPIQHLTNYLQNYLSARTRNDETFATSSMDNNAQVVAYNIIDNESLNEIMKDAKIFENNSDQNDNNSNNDNYNSDNDDDEAAIKRMEERDEHGQSMLHFSCARSNRKGALINLIEESNIDITYRDELYRTARDISCQANQLSNAKEIDRYILSLAVLGDIKPFEHLSISGYDHIIDIYDDNELSIIEIAEQRGNTELVNFLQNLRIKEELREELHQMIRDNNLQRALEIINSSNGRWLIKAKNYYGRTALHIAILKESEELVEKFIAICPEAIYIGDNLERSPLHYAMGTDNIENLSRILIQNGAKRTVKDLKGRQPSYYFMNKADILRLQEEENEIR